VVHPPTEDGSPGFRMLKVATDTWKNQKQTANKGLSSYWKLVIMITQQYNTEIKNEWSDTTTPPIHLHGVNTNNFCFSQNHTIKKSTIVENTLGLVNKSLNKTQEPENGIDFEI